MLGSASTLPSDFPSSTMSQFDTISCQACLGGPTPLSVYYSQNPHCPVPHLPLGPQMPGAVPPRSSPWLPFTSSHSPTTLRAWVLSYPSLKTCLRFRYSKATLPWALARLTGTSPWYGTPMLAALASL